MGKKKNERIRRIFEELEQNGKLSTAKKSNGTSKTASTPICHCLKYAGKLGYQLPETFVRCRGCPNPTIPLTQTDESAKV